MSVRTNTLIAAIGAALIGLVVSLLQLSPGYAAMQLGNGHWQWFPRLGSTAETMVLYHGVVDASAFLLGIGGLFVLGYRFGVPLESSRQFGRFAVAVGLGALIGALVPVVVVFGTTLFVGDSSVFATVGQLFTVDFPSTLLAVGRPLGFGIQSALIACAGAALATVANRGGDNRGDEAVQTGSVT
ncbi:uncharacterized protein Nmag_1222 [Natrialba magadii ATCC 43099]|uniref:Uncharacterized protein n=1 Tax=Natrialba magadii (strain ATCC 43099 / DSM 3394 / CCM 3739 / CIP 104546 / IAM 13178 / JCM 8861 / NBRC 102185 / NCIMB 2190 / MS3) TaxID=547559 RepID=D3SS78_NATMM|nr:hypothetical protein [Natrialba magadii]ADD04804.1 uncharacterized protein Nmag_1222 [Natrialba magadii ATCC 43099]ELY24471.1 hypothetical protein C500_18625 [Natrialba magadii ATCC 43099]